jgi:8-oxo-dGTP diphosphatase
VALPGVRRVVAAVVHRNGRFLVARRPADKKHGNLWEFPGGKVAPGETLADALTRELAEELDVRPRDIGACLHVELDHDSGFEIHFIATHIAGEPRCLEHSAIAWCNPAELGALALAPADARFVRTRLTVNPD